MCLVPHMHAGLFFASGRAYNLKERTLVGCEDDACLETFRFSTLGTLIRNITLDLLRCYFEQYHDYETDTKHSLHH